MGDSLMDAARQLLGASAGSPRRRARRKPKPVAPVTEWATYPHEFVPIKALCQRWGETEQSVRKWIRNGVLPASRFGRRWKVARADAQAFELRAKVAV